MTKTMLLTQRHKSIAKLFDENYGELLGWRIVEVRKDINPCNWWYMENKNPGTKVPG
jgi:hypothetical protein